jgi:predicted small lipoprotein YifL
LRVVCNRRSFLGLVSVITLGGLGSACGVKGPLYLPRDEESEKQKKKDDDKTSQRLAEPLHANHG